MLLTEVICVVPEIDGMVGNGTDMLCNNAANEASKVWMVCLNPWVWEEFPM